MARTHTFKGSASAGYGYFAYIEDGQLVIGHHTPYEGSGVFMGSYEGAIDYWLPRVREEDQVLYDDIEKYFTKHGVNDSQEDIKKKYGFDEATKTVLFKVKLFMDNGAVHNVLVRGRTQSGIIFKLMKGDPEVHTLQTWDAREFAVRSEKISAIEFMED